MEAPIIRFSWTRLQEFVKFWSALYWDSREELYFDNIGRALTPERVENLYHWKCGDRFWERQRRDVERNVIGRLGDLRRLGRDCPPMGFLRRFETVGRIWSIFLLHIWQHEEYPIYDRHTHRAMRFIQERRIEEIPQNLRETTRTYIDHYLPFFSEFPRMPDRKVDKALFAFGRFLKSPPGQRAVMVHGGQRP